MKTSNIEPPSCNSVLDLQIATETENYPAPEKLQIWMDEALKGKHKSAEICVRIVDKAEMIALNQEFRNKDKASNVLSFPTSAEIAAVDTPPHLGDIVMCAETINKEALDLNIPTDEHWAHMLVHSILHLLGYDHMDDADALEMESLEKNILLNLGFQNPYGDNTTNE